jgi:hypothetical protein
MYSTQTPFSRAADCPVVKQQVSLSGLRVTMKSTGATAVANKSCSRAESCLAAHGSLERIQGCLVLTLS